MSTSSAAKIFENQQGNKLDGQLKGKGKNLVDSGSQKRIQKFSKLEIITYFIFYVIFFYIVQEQLNIKNSQQISKNIEKYYFSEFQDRKQLDISINELAFWLKNKLLTKFYEQSTGDNKFAIPLDFQKLSGIRITTKRGAIDPLSNNLMKPLVDDYSNYGTDYQYSYNDINEGYSTFFHVQNETYAEAQQKMDNLFDEGYLDVSVASLSIDSIFYVANSDMISFFVAKFDFPPEGSVVHEIIVRSFRIYPYNTTEDYIRFIFEIIFAGFLIAYSVYEFFKVYQQYSTVLAEKNKAAKTKRRQQQLQEELKKQDYNQYQTQQSQQQKQSYKKNNTESSDGGRNTGLGAANMSIPSDQDGRIKKKKTDQFKQGFQNMGDMLVGHQLQSFILGFKIHVSNIWSLLDVLNIIFNVVSIFRWISLNDKENNEGLKLILNQEASKVDQFQYGLDEENYLLVQRELQNQFKLNNTLEDMASDLKNYQLFLSLSAVIMSFKIIKYIISTSENLQNYMTVIMTVLNFLFYSMVLLLTILISFSYFVMLYYGNTNQQFATFEDTLVSMLGWMLGTDLILDELLRKSELVTMLFAILFFITITSIIMNMFWVFSKNALEGFLELKKLKQEQNKEDQSDQTHAINKFFDKIKEVKLKIRGMTRDEKIEKQRRHHQLEKDFNQKHDIPYDVTFDQELQKSEYNPSKFYTEKERKKMEKQHKLSLVKLVYSSCVLILIILVNVLLSYQFFHPQQQYEFNKLLQDQIWEQDLDVFGEQTSFEDTNNHQTIISYFHQAFQTIFEQRNVQINTLTKYKFSQDSINHIKNLEINQPLAGETQKKFEDLTLPGYSLQFFNILAFNKVRFTLRRVKIKENDSPLKNIQSEIIAGLFGPYASSGQESEITEDIKVSGFDIVTGVPFGNRTYEYHTDKGFAQNGGYVIHLEPKDIQISIEQMYLDQVFDNGINCVVADFILVNFVKDISYTYCSIEVEFGPMGYTTIKKIKSKSFFRPDIIQGQGFLFSISLIILVLAAFYFTSHLIYTIYYKYTAYEQWYKLYVVNFLSEGQRYFRQRKCPEFIRKLEYVVSLGTVLNTGFVILLTLEIMFLIIEILFIIYIEFAVRIFEVPIVELFTVSPFQRVASYNELDFEQVMNNIHFMKKYSDTMMQPIFSLSIYFTCIQLIYNLTYYKDFARIFNALKKIFTDIMYLVFLLIGFLMAFALQSHYYLGTKYLQFSTLFKSFVILTEFLYSLSAMEIFIEGDTVYEVVFFLIPYMICIRFLLLTVFYSTTYIGYKQLKESSQQEEESHFNSSIGLKEFIELSKEFFQEKSSNPVNIQFLKQQIEIIDEQILTMKVKETIKNYKPNMPIQVWADMCAQNIKQEHDIRSSLQSICDEIVSRYLKQTNNGDMGYFKNLERDPERKLEEYLIRLKLWDYYRTFHLFQQKACTFFDKKAQLFREKIQNKNEPGNVKEEMQYFLTHYLDLLEKTLEQNMYTLKNLKNERNIQIQRSQRQQKRSSVLSYTEQDKQILAVQQQESLSSRNNSFQENTD